MTLRFLKVNGNSMHPTLTSGAFVLVWQSSWCYRPCLIPFLNRLIALKVGDIVAINHPRYGEIIKRVADLEYEDVTTHSFKQFDARKHRAIERMRLSGDNQSASVSEDAMGWVAVDCLIGKVIYVINK